MSDSAHKRNTPPRRGDLGAHDDEIDYAHRHFVNLTAAMFLLCIAVLMVWTLKAMDSQESLRKCAASGRKDCIQISAPPRGMVQAVR